MIPLITFDDFRDPTPMSSFSKKIWVPPLNPSKVFSDPPLGSSDTTDPPFCSPKNEVIPPKILRPPAINNDRSLNPKGLYVLMAFQWVNYKHLSPFPSIDSQQSAAIEISNPPAIWRVLLWIHEGVLFVIRLKSCKLFSLQTTKQGSPQFVRASSTVY